MLKLLVTRRLAPWRRAGLDQGSQVLLHRCRPLLEVLEDKILLSFITAPTYTVGSYPDSVAVGDFSGDGHRDLAVANSTRPGTVCILLNKGDGTFQAAQSYAVGADPDSVVVADFNGDGRLDLAAANAGAYPNPGTVSVLLGNGDGTFQAAHSYTVGFHPTSVAVGNFDGHLDLAVANYFSGTVSVLLGNGDGTFRAAQSYAVGCYPESVAVGDFNRDGHLDLAAAGYDDQGKGTVSILLANGDGTFQIAQRYAAGAGAASVTVGDFDGEGSPDLAVANSTDSALDTVTILLGRGDGTFQAAPSVATGAGASFVAVGDFSSGGKLDLAVADSSGVSVLLGNGAGAFEAPQLYGVGSSHSVAVGDLDGDGHLDLVVANYYANTVSVLLGRGDGTFQAQASYAVGLSPVCVAVGDFEGNGHRDLAVANSGEGDGTIAIPSYVSVLTGSGQGTFQAAVNYADYSYPQSVAVGDFNGDGHADLVVAGGFGVTIWLGNGDGTFQEPLLVYGVGFNYSVAVGDFNGDGHLDLAVAQSDLPTGTGRVIVLLGNGDGTFQAAQSYAVGRRPSSLAVADFDGDGTPDLAVATHGTYPDHQATVSILLGNGDGTFQAAQNYTIGADSGRLSVVAGDFNGHGTPDLAVVNFGNSPDYQGTVSILLGNGDGTFEVSQTYAAGPYASSVAVGDFNRDGSLDLAVGNNSGVRILLGNGDGTFQAAQSYAAGGYPISIVVGDFNGNGYPDLAVADYSSNTVTVLMNAADWGGRPSPRPPAVPPRGPFVHRLVPNRPQLRTVPSSLAASKPETACALTFPDLPPRLVRYWSLRAETGQPVRAEVTFIPRPRLTTRHAQDAVFERWGDGVLDEMAWDA